MIKLLPAIKDGIRLSRLVKSQTTREQWKGGALVAVMVCVALAALRGQFPQLDISEEVLVGLAVTLLTAVAPLMARILAFWDTPAVQHGHNATTLVNRVRTKSQSAWRPFVGSILDAAEELWDFAVDDHGRIYDLKQAHYTGAMFPIPPSDRNRVSG